MPRLAGRVKCEVGHEAVTTALVAETQQYYATVAAMYRHTVPDWSGAVERQADVLDGIISSTLGPGCYSVLDCTCGVGTQVLGLSQRGHRVTGTDISPAAIALARSHAAEFGVAAELRVADVRNLAPRVPERFDVVISADNSLPHLLTADAMRAAMASIYGRLRPGGLVLVSMRDYDRHLASRPTATQPDVWTDEGTTRVAFQLWDWLDDNIYRTELFLLQGQRGRWEMQTYEGATYRAWRRREVSGFLACAGYSDVTWHAPQTTGFHQPIVSCRRPATR